jgi:putative transposase
VDGGAPSRVWDGAIVPDIIFVACTTISSISIFPVLKIYFSSCDVRHDEFWRLLATLSGMDAQRTFFITSVTWRRIPIFRKDARARLLIEVMLDYREQGKYWLHEFVVMPDHIHVLLTPGRAIALERAVQFIKGGFSYRLGKVEKMEVWQPSFTNHRIRDAEDFERHRDYVRSNPVRAKLVREPAEYLYSSANSAFRVDDAPRGLKPDWRESA